jgi:hypothetical protein
MFSLYTEIEDKLMRFFVKYLFVIDNCLQMRKGGGRNHTLPAEVSFILRQVKLEILERPNWL